MKVCKGISGIRLSARDVGGRHHYQLWRQWRKPRKCEAPEGLTLQVWTERAGAGGQGRPASTITAMPGEPGPFPVTQQCSKYKIHQKGKQLFIKLHGSVSHYKQDRNTKALVWRQGKSALWAKRGERLDPYSPVGGMTAEAKTVLTWPHDLVICYFSSPNAPFWYQS